MLLEVAKENRMWRLQHLVQLAAIPGEHQKEKKNIIQNNKASDFNTEGSFP